jgi:hypothetical protein
MASPLVAACACAWVLLTGGWQIGSARAEIAGSGGGNGSTTQGQAADSQSSVAASSPNGGFGISGSVKGLYPGKVAPLALKVTNPQKFAITVTSLTVAVKSASATCTAANVTVTSFTGSLSVPALGTATATVQFTLLHSAPNACQGAVFPLQYSGQATKS